MQAWRKNLFEHHLVESLTALELVLSAIFLAISHAIASPYLKGVGIGLVIAWVTGAIAYLLKKNLK